MTERCFIVAIDGPSGAGKSTVARRVAESLGYHFLDSGALYRAVALAALEAKIDPHDEAALGRLLAGLRIEVDDAGRVLLAGRDVGAAIRTEQVSQAASRLSSLPEVRAALIAVQRKAARPPGTVAEGRDIGTVVFPHAQLKIFLDAEVDERARRRARELRGRGTDVDAAAVKTEMNVRDSRDRTRPLAPLRAAPDAVVVDSTKLTVDEVVARITEEARQRADAASD